MSLISRVALLSAPFGLPLPAAGGFRALSATFLLRLQPFNTDHERAIPQTVDVVAEHLGELLRYRKFQRRVPFSGQAEGLPGRERRLKQHRIRRLRLQRHSNNSNHHNEARPRFLARPRACIPRRIEDCPVVPLRIDNAPTPSIENMLAAVDRPIPLSTPDPLDVIALPNVALPSPDSDATPADVRTDAETLLFASDDDATPADVRTLADVAAPTHTTEARPAAATTPAPTEPDAADATHRRRRTGRTGGRK